MFEHDFLALFPEIFPINATIISLIYGVVFSTSEKYDYPPLVRNVGWLGLLSVLITILLVAVGSPPAVANLVYNNLIIDNFTYFCQIFLLLSTASTMAMCLDYSKQESSNAFESIVPILFPTRSMLFMISAYDSIAMYLAIELQSLCFYVIAASRRDSEFSAEAGLKYFILGAFSSGILLFGRSMIYGFTGVTNFEELAKIFTGYEITLFGAQSSGIFMGILFIAAGFLFKITAVPFHMWAPDVYEGSPTIVTAFFSIAPKISILANMLRVFIYSFYDPTWQQLFFLCSIASMILGALAAMAQNKVKRLLAYSSIGHVGYLLIGFSRGTIEGIQSLLIGTFIYVLMTVNAFAMVLALRQNRFKYIADLGALAKTNPILAITPSITMFSYAGVPPLAGFCSKFYLFFAALGCGAYSLALIGVVTSVISRFYYIRFVKIMYFDTPETWILYKPMDREKSLLPAITVFFITFFFPYPSPSFLVTHQMALCPCL
uniref:NADH dehydrogenase subunit 2 n=1 Tax=Aneura pinguis TaxID=39026 RepID=A0A221SD50_ANEPI|nr:NADH dehydrogenase subunit 2 [Aneura pinguis]ASN73966.1 NADH dehydrogenase subunit 2 [Aneura pinguis]WHW95825.1 NADH dehydrogenase subunit 2 [Aneura pinguis]WHW95867.1 NADH dehydrogenase subunit 2 [Aneura pinguis]WHW95909.1 NADH dehydrogenase subunit 2 [Aneura pinguis]